MLYSTRLSQLMCYAVDLLAKELADTEELDQAKAADLGADNSRLAQEVRQLEDQTADLMFKVIISSIQ